VRTSVDVDPRQVPDPRPAAEPVARRRRSPWRDALGEFVHPLALLLARRRSEPLITKPQLLFVLAVTCVPGVNSTLGMALPAAWALALLPVFALAMWAPDEAVGALRRRRADVRARGQRAMAVGGWRG
jgi:hypothetical protein